MAGRIVDEVWGLYQYRLPVSAVPEEADKAWAEWLRAFVGRDASDIHQLLAERLSRCSTSLAGLADAVLEHTPCSIIVRKGTPYLCLANKDEYEGVVCLAPEVGLQQVQHALEPHGLAGHQLLVELFALFGGLSEQRTCHGINFAAERISGGADIEPAAVDFEAGFEYLTEAEIQERRRNFAPWMGGVQVLQGGDGLYWHIGAEGTVCEHECGCAEINGYFESLDAMIAAFLEAAKSGGLFNGAYYGLPGRRNPE